jgi:hypothetical protein
MTELVWRKEMPDKPGKWWRRVVGSDPPPEPEIMEFWLRESTGELMNSHDGPYEPTPVNWYDGDHVEWAGPLPLPKEPT